MDGIENRTCDLPYERLWNYDTFFELLRSGLGGDDSKGRLEVFISNYPSEGSSPGSRWDAWKASFQRKRRRDEGVVGDTYAEAWDEGRSYRSALNASDLSGFVGTVRELL